MSRRVGSRYPHVFSKGRGVAFVSDGSRRGSRGGQANPCLIQTESLGRAVTDPPTPPEPPDPPPVAARWKALRVNPTIADLHRRRWGVAVICADCLHGVAYRNAGLPGRFKREWGATLLEIERRRRCRRCGSRNARVYPWEGEGR